LGFELRASGFPVLWLLVWVSCWPGTAILLPPTSQVAGITGVSHYTWPWTLVIFVSVIACSLKQWYLTGSHLKVVICFSDGTGHGTSFHMPICPLCNLFSKVSRSFSHF
jgi:hypothetical protein